MTPRVDMSREAVTARLREASALSDLTDPFRPRVDMSRDAISRRLQEVSQLNALCERLDRAGRSWPHPVMPAP